MTTEPKKDPWSLEELMACEYCKGAAYIFRPCKVHGGTPLNTYFEIQRMRSMQEWECKRCHAKGWNDLGTVPYMHLCPDKRPKPLDLFPLTNLAYKPRKSIIALLDEMEKEACEIMDLDDVDYKRITKIGNLNRNPELLS